MLSRVRRTVLGTMEFGRGPCTAGVAKEMTESFLNSDKSYRHLDTALMYSGGKSETIIGDMSCLRDKAGFVDTKINPWDNKNFGEESIRAQVEGCLSRLKTSSVEILYLHAPDHKTPLEQTMKTMNDLYQEGKFKQLGQVEEELIPCLRYHNIAFYAYSPLGGGILSGKYQFQDQSDKKIPKGRFNGVGWDKVYRDRYWKEEHFLSMEKLKELLSQHHPDEKITIPGAAFRWLYNHSLLDGSKGDAVVLGASRLEQVSVNLELTKAGPLHQDVVNFMEDWWKSTKHLCPIYFR